MRKLLKLIFKETSLLKRTLSVIFVILTAFGAAFMAVVSVMSDTPDGLYYCIDDAKPYYASAFGGENFALYADNADVSVADRYGAELCYGTKNGITQDAVLSCGDRQFESDVVTMLGSGQQLEYRVERHGYIVPLRYVQASREYAEQGILLCDETATELNVGVGDVIAIGEEEFVLLDTYDRSAVSDYAPSDAVMPSAWYYIISDQDIMFDRLYFTYGTSRQIMNIYRTGEGLGMSKIFVDWAENIAVVETYYGYLALLLGALIVFVLYVLFTLFFRLRKAQICRLKLLGATNVTIAGIYMSVAVVILFVSTLLATALSVLLSKYLLGVCVKLFSVEFTYHFRVWLPLALFGGGSLLSAVMMSLLQYRISRVPIAQEVRYE